MSIQHLVLVLIAYLSGLSRPFSSTADFTLRMMKL